MVTATTAGQGTTRGQRQRAAVTDALRDLLAEVPIDEVTVGDLSARAGIARSVFYFHFASKFAVLERAVATAAVDLEASIASMPPRRRDEVGHDYLIRVLRTAAEVNQRHLPVVRAALASYSVDAGVAARAEQVIDVCTARAAELLRTEGFGSHGEDSEFETVVRLLIVTTLLAGQHAALISGDDDPDRAIDALATIWRRSLDPSPPRPRGGRP